MRESSGSGNQIKTPNSMPSDRRGGTSSGEPGNGRQALETGAPAVADAIDWDKVTIIRANDPSLGTPAQRRALQEQLHKQFDRITDTCLTGWVPPQGNAGKDGLVPVRLALALGIVSREGHARIQHASLESANLSDSDLERCLTEQAKGNDISLSTSYQEPTGGLRSLPPLPDGNFRLWYPVALGVPAHRAPRGG